MFKRIMSAMALTLILSPVLNAGEISVIPKPVSLMEQEGTFVLTAQTSIRHDGSEAGIGVAHYLQQRLSVPTGFVLMLEEGQSDQGAFSSIRLTLTTPVVETVGGSYTLQVDGSGVEISASDREGLFNGTQTLLQLFPPEIFSKSTVAQIDWTLPAVDIEDAPRFQYRGALLDLSRHFFTLDEVFRLIDLLAMHKINHLHLHLTDDPGWRIEVKQYPKLTSVGGVGEYSDINGRKEKLMFFSQEEIREIVNYAASRSMVVVPEIDMPGHAGAALRAYPGMGDTRSTFNMAKPETIEFLKNIIDETAALFPGGYFHMGGDEVRNLRMSKLKEVKQMMRKNGWKDHRPVEAAFAQEMVEYIQSKGLVAMGWDEIAEHHVNSDTVIYWWRGVTEGTLDTVMAGGHRVVMSPVQITYFDYPHKKGERGAPWEGGLTPLDMVYDWNPVPEHFTDEESSRVIGVQGHLWSEFIENMPRLEMMGFPRFSALAEAGWTPQEGRNWSDFQNRLSKQKQRYDQMDLNYYGRHNQ